MPTYTYACTECGEQLEVVQSLSDAPLVECPHCSGRLRKVFHPVGVMFKGSGFYRTDSRATTEHNGKAAGTKADKADGAGSTEGSSATPSGAGKDGSSGGGAAAGAGGSGSGTGSSPGSGGTSSGGKTPAARQGSGTRGSTAGTSS